MSTVAEPILALPVKVSPPAVAWPSQDPPPPRVTVLMAVHNAAEYLDSAIRSVLGQTYRDFELLILDDGSDDATPALLADFAASDSRVRVVAGEKRGLTRTLNVGLGLARGALIARMDGDDLCRPDRLQKQVAYMDAHPEVVLLGGAFEMIDGVGRTLRVFDPPLDDRTLQQHCLSGRTPVCHPLAMMRADAVRRVGGYDEQYVVAQDLDLWLRLGEVGRMACLPDVLLDYRMHPKSVSERKQEQQIQNMRRACETAWARRGTTDHTFGGAGGWRAIGDRASQHSQLLKFGWWAFNSGHWRTAALYGLKAVATRPLTWEGWNLLACGLLKTPVAQVPPSSALRPRANAAGPLGAVPPVSHTRDPSGQDATTS